ncbi:MAG: hypothetical protein SFU85_01580 [Candidatus Methylacidiphilales bacterium]|nr:hypothetical protein [Candidatus Methylacidiphilales bacterium]
MTEPVLVWLHGDSLSPEDPAARLHPGARRVFVFDRPLLERSPLSFKRIFFLYECAGEAADELRVGDPVEELISACHSAGVRRIAVTESLAPRFHELVTRLGESMAVEIVPADSFVPVPADYVPKRFSAFWKNHGREWQ